MKAFLMLLLVLITVSSCDLPEHYFTSSPECTDEKAIVEGDALTTENQGILRETIKGKTPKVYRYFFEIFVEEGDNTYMITNFRNEEACFSMKILVDKWDKLEGMRQANGEAYPKELYDLEWELKTVNGQEEVVYIDMHRIID